MPDDIELHHIKQCASDIAPYVEETPVSNWRSQCVRQLLGPLAEIQLKLEFLQHAGSFKARAAVANVMALSEQERGRGVTAVSAGNHAIAVAYAARVLQTHAKVVMQSSANAARIQAARDLGAEVVMAEPGPAAFEAAQRISQEEGRAFIHPFEGRTVSLATATVGREFLLQSNELDTLIVAVGGGGLASGVSRACRLMAPDCRVIGVEPEGANTMSLSFSAGTPQTLERVTTIADSLGPPMALPYSFDLCRKGLDDLVTVPDADIVKAMRLLFEDRKLALEPAACAGVACLMGSLRHELRDQRIGIILCGSNIDLSSFAAHIG